MEVFDLFDLLTCLDRKKPFVQRHARYERTNIRLLAATLGVILLATSAACTSKMTTDSACDILVSRGTVKAEDLRHAANLVDEPTRSALARMATAFAELERSDETRELSDLVENDPELSTALVSVADYTRRVCVKN